jgi:hypothetical protein
MAIRFAFSLCLVTVMVISTGCATAPKKTLSDQLAEARRSLAMIKVESKIELMTTQQLYSLPEGADKKKAIEDEQKLDKAFSEMLTACQGTVAGFESQGRKWGGVKLGVAIVGTVAGAIVVPALTAAAATANAVWISGFGGVAGASNAAQQALSDVGFTPTSVLQTRQNILDDWKAATNVYFKPESSYADKKAAIQKGLTACTLYAITVPGQLISSPQTQ